VETTKIAAEGKKEHSAQEQTVLLNTTPNGFIIIINSA
jgi:hypothetical protein